MTTIVIMPGGFHPFHAGHYELYKSAQRAFPDAEVFVAATNDTSARPFPFPVKEKLAKLAGVEPGHFVQVKSPFKAEEITAGFDPARDTLIFVRSEKDSTKPPQAGGVKKDGSPAYLQPLLGAKKLEPFAKHAYMAYLPTVEFGPGMTSATEIRSAWPQLDERRKTALVMSLYPRTQGNAKLAATVVGLLDAAIGTEQGVAEGLGKDIKRLATGKDVKSRAGQEIAKSQDASMKGDHKTSKKHFDRYDKLDKLANKEQGVAEGLENFNGIQLSLEIQKDDEFVDDDDTDNQTIFVQATASGRELGQVVFAIDYDDKGMILVPQDLEVDERFRGQGIAATMYDYVKSKGYRIQRSYDQTPAGAGFWDKHKPGKDIWEQGVAEGKRKKKSRNRGFGGYFFPGYGYYGGDASGGGGRGFGGESRSDMAEARRNPEQNTRSGSGKYDLINYAEDIADKDNWAVSMTMEPKLGVNPRAAVSEDTPKGIYFYPLRYFMKMADRDESLPWGDNFPYIQLFQYDRSGEMTQQTKVDPAKLKQALLQYCPEEVIQQVSEEGEYDGTPYWFIYDCLSRLGKSDETNVIRWNKVLRDLGFTSVYDPGHGWIAYNEPTQGVVLDPRIIKQHKMFSNRNPTLQHRRYDIQGLADSIGWSSYYQRESQSQRIYNHPDEKKVMLDVAKSMLKPFLGKSSEEAEEMGYDQALKAAADKVIEILKSSNKSVTEASLGNVLSWPEVVNKINSAMKATGWKSKREGENTFMFTSKGQETDDQWYIILIANQGNGMFTYALGTVEDGDPYLDDAFKGTLPATEASVSELLGIVRDGFGLNEQGVVEAFDKPYRSKTEKSESGSFDVLAKLPDGTNLSIMFNNEGNDEWQVEFYRNNSQEVTGEGDAQRIFATVLSAIQKFITKHKPAHLTFAASKETDPTVYYEPGEPQPNPASRAKLYDRLVQRYAKSWGYKAFRADNGHIVMYELSRMKPAMAEDYLEEKWSEQYKQSINCSNPKGFSQRAHCAGRKN